MNVAAKEIITDEFLLSRKSINIDPAGEIEEGTGMTRFKVPTLQVIDELIATAEANKGRCAGLAANQIGYLARIFIIRLQPSPGVTRWYPIINPEIISRSPERKQEKEWCLSRPDQPPIRVKRHKSITLKYTILNEKGEPEEMKDKISGFNARVVQHELDHFEGKLI